MQLFPAPQHPPQTPHMVAPPPTMPPPPPYEEDPNQRAAAPGGFVYYAPTYYPGQVGNFSSVVFTAFDLHSLP